MLNELRELGSAMPNNVIDIFSTRGELIDGVLECPECESHVWLVNRDGLTCDGCGNAYGWGTIVDELRGAT